MACADTTRTNTKHSSKEARETADARVHNRRARVPLNITFDVFEATPFFVFTFLDQDSSHIEHSDENPSEHDKVGQPKGVATALDADGAWKGTAALQQVDGEHDDKQGNKN